MVPWYGFVALLMVEEGAKRSISPFGCIDCEGGDKMRRLTKDGLEYAVSGAGPVVVAFSASWCLSSLDLAAALEQIGEAMGADRVTVGVIEVDEDPSIPARYGVRGLPTTMLFKNGAIVATKVGGLTRRQLHDWVYDHV